MSADWNGFLRSLMQDHKHVGIDPYEAWVEFRQRAKQSQSVDDLMSLVGIIDPLPDDARVVAAIAIAKLLAQYEWPPAADEARHKLADAIASVIHEIDPGYGGTLGHVLRDRLQGGELGSLRNGLDFVRQLLDGPSRPDQVVQIAGVCNVIMRACLHALRTAMDGASEPLAQPLADARVSFLYAFGRYRDAVRDFNSKLGGVYFGEMSPPLG